MLLILPQLFIGVIPMYLMFEIVTAKYLMIIIMTVIIPTPRFTQTMAP